MEQRTFYYRADGDLINGEFSYTETPEFFDDDDACDVIAEVYVKVKSRVLRMGEKELCDRCGGEGELPASTIFMGLNDDTLVIDCPDCEISLAFLPHIDQLQAVTIANLHNTRNHGGRP